MFISPTSEQQNYQVYSALLTFSIKQHDTVRSHDTQTVCCTYDLVNEVIHGLPRFHQHHHASRPLQLGHHVLDRGRTDDLRALRLTLQELSHLGYRPVERNHLQRTMSNLKTVTPAGRWSLWSLLTGRHFLENMIGFVRILRQIQSNY